MAIDEVVLTFSDGHTITKVRDGDVFPVLRGLVRRGTRPVKAEVWGDVVTVQDKNELAIIHTVVEPRGTVLLNDTLGDG